MKKVSILSFSIFLLSFLSFQDDTQYYKNLDARKTDGSTTYFSLAKNDIVAESEAWDVSFNRTSITIKGTYTLIEKPFEQIKEVPQNKEFSAGDRPIKDWYDYDAGTHTIFTIPNKVYILRSADEKVYTKFQVISYYKDAPETPVSGQNDPGFYTFRFQRSQEGKISFGK